jgi:hypothetical protein
VAYDYAFVAVDEERVTRFVRYACLRDASHEDALATALAERFNVWGPAAHFKERAAELWAHDDLRFDHFFYLWGRPWFVLERDAEPTSKALEALRHAGSQAAVAAKLHEQVRRFRPEAERDFEALALRSWKDETADDRRAFLRAQQEELATLHALFAGHAPSLRLHGTVAAPGGRPIGPSEFAQRVAFRAAELAGLTAPFWVSRNVALGDLLELGDLAASPLFLFARAEGFERRLLQLVPSRVTERTSTGVYVRNKDLPALAELLYRPPQELLEKAPGAARLELPAVRRVGRLLREAVEHCRRTGAGLWEVEGLCRPFDGDWP